MIPRLGAGLLCCLAAYAQAASPPRTDTDPWQALRFLLGAWEAKTQGGSAGAASTGTYTFRLDLGNHVLVRESASAACKGPANFNCEHGDLLYVYPETPVQPLKAIYFDSEGHVIHYDVTTPTPNKAVLISAASQPGPQYQLIYELKGKVMEGKFRIRMPGQSEFRSYLEWAGGKK